MHIADSSGERNKKCGTVVAWCEQPGDLLIVLSLRKDPFEHTVPLETMGPFAVILPRSNRGFDLQFHLGKTPSNRIKNLGFT